MWALARGVVGHRLWVLGVAIAVVGGLAWPASQIEVGYSIASFVSPDDPELRSALAHYDQGFDAPDHLLLFAYDDSAPLSPAGLERTGKLAAAFGRLSGVEKVVWAGSAPGFFDPVAAARSHTWRRLFVGREDGIETGVGGVVVLERDLAVDLRLELFAAMERAGAAEGVDVRLMGLPHHTAHRVATVREDQSFFLPLATLMAALVLFWLIPRWTLALQAVLVAPLTVLSTVGTMSRCGVSITMLTSVLPTLLLAIAVADGVHLVGRFIEQRRRGQRPEDAAVAAMVHTFFPCLLTTLTTALGFLSLTVARVADLVDLGLFAALGLVFAFVFTMAVLPAAASMVKAMPGSRRLDPVGAIVRWLAERSGGLRWQVLGIAGVLLGAAVVMAGQITKDSRLQDDYWPDDPVVVETAAYEARHVPMIPGEVLVTARGSFRDDGPWAELEQVVERLERLPGMVRTLSVLDPVRDGVPRMLVFAGSDRMPVPLLDGEARVARVLTFQRDRGMAYFRDHRERLARWNDKLEHVEVAAVGGQVIGAATVDQLVDDLGQSFLGSLVLILVLIGAVFRSLRLGLIALVPSVVPLVVNLGVMGGLGITLRPLTSITFCVAFGLAVDDTVHILARYREERQLGLAQGDALRHCLLTAGRPVVVTTLLLLVGFGTILFSGFQSIALFGALVGLALLGALVGAMVLLPALLRVTERDPRPGR